MGKTENKKKEPFTVPEGYFEQLNSRILDATAGKTTVKPKRKKEYVIGKFSRIAGYAAAIAIIVGITANFLTPWHKVADDSTTSDNVYADNDYIDNILNSYTIDEYTFYCYLTDSDFE